MKSILVLCAALVASAFANPAPRSYLREGDQRFVYIPDEDGNLHYVDLLHIPRFDPIDANNITFYIFTPSNKVVPLVVKPNEFEKLVNSPYYDPSLPNFFTAHGWTGDANSTNVREVKDALLAYHNVNVFGIDYSGISHLFYTIARSHINVMGDIIGDFINRMVDHYNIEPSAFALMGHSLGGQLVGRIGYAVNGDVGIIIGLDPAGPMFPADILEERLDPSDGAFVQIIHTNAGFLGFPDACGHADFWPNGGVKQTDCGPDIIGTCSHFLVKDFAPEAILSSGFIGVRCDSYDSYLAGNCNGNEQSWFAGWPVDTSARGDYYLRTNGQPPFALG